MGQETYDLARDILLRLLRFESLSSSESGAIEYIADLLDSWGFDFKLQSIGSGSYNIIVNNNRTPLLSIATHIDTVRIYSLPKSDEKYVCFNLNVSLGFYAALYLPYLCCLSWSMEISKADAGFSNPQFWSTCGWISPMIPASFFPSIILPALPSMKLS